MKILAIETSCDETAAALVEAKNGKFKIEKNLVASQIKIHQKYGGVVPSLAKREHQKNLPILLRKALVEFSIFNFQFSKEKKKKFLKILEREKEMARKLWLIASKINPVKINLIAVTIGPGLEPALWVGVNTAKALTYLWQKPVIGVNHLKGHMYSPLLNPVSHRLSLCSTEAKPMGKYNFPILHLLVSGGHTELVLMKDYEKFRLLGETRDDAAGEAFDKVAKLLNLPYPGGPIIEKLAKLGNPKAIAFPRPMSHSEDLDFSFSGLKTAVLYEIQGNPSSLRPRPRGTQGLGLRSEYVNDIAASFQEAVVDSLIIKTQKAAELFRPKAIIISGGVSANKYLYQKMRKELYNYNIVKPAKKYALDNAAMIGVAGYFQSFTRKPTRWHNLKAKANLNIKCPKPDVRF